MSTTTTTPRIALRQAAMIMEIDARPELDPIRVIFQDVLGELGRGRVIVQCFDCAWTAWWGAMGKRTVKEFFLSCDAHYLAANLIANRDCREAYVVRIVEAIQQALREDETEVALRAKDAAK